TMAHGLKSLCVLRSPTYKRLYLEVWRGLVIKACTSAVLARELGGAAPETALLASMLTDLGKLLVLSAFMDNEVPVDVEQYKRMCRENALPRGVLRPTR